MTTNTFFFKLVLVVLCQLATMFMTLVVAISVQNPDGISINVHYLGSIEGKSFFAESETRRNWTEAKEYCEESGMHLASIDSDVQTKFLSNSFNNVTFNGAFWTGGRDAMAASQYVWDHTGETLDEKFNKLANIRGIQSCIFWDIYTETNGHLDSFSCSDRHGVLCEINVG